MEFLWEQHKRTSATSGPVDLENETQDLMGMTSINLPGVRTGIHYFLSCVSYSTQNSRPFRYMQIKPVDNGSFYYEMI